MSTSNTVQVSESIGRVSATTITSAKPKSVLLLAHGAGAGMNHPFMTSLCTKLAEHSIASIRFNFAYMEKKSKRPDPPAVAEKTVAALIEYAHQEFAELPLFVGGKSFGGRMSSQRLSKECPPYIKGIVFYGFPLHPAGAPAIDRAAHLSAIKIPMLFLQGSRDSLAELQLIKGVCKKLKTATLEVIEGADHSFKAGKQDLIPLLADLTNSWMDRITDGDR